MATSHVKQHLQSYLLNAAQARIIKGAQKVPFTPMSATVKQLMASTGLTRVEIEEAIQNLPEQECEVMQGVLEHMDMFL